MALLLLLLLLLLLIEVRKGLLVAFPTDWLAKQSQSCTTRGWTGYVRNRQVVTISTSRSESTMTFTLQKFEANFRFTPLLMHRTPRRLSKIASFLSGTALQ
jgi:hypothetical protein